MCHNKNIDIYIAPGLKAYVKGAAITHSKTYPLSEGIFLYRLLAADTKSAVFFL